ncbi:MAG: GtrA family protein [Firmicutes bacterium]|nr:GtrA family protein [Bacillota bacterium]
MSEETKPESAWERFDNKLGAKHPEIWKIVKWMAVGFISNVPELGVYMLCLYGFRARGVTNLSIFGFMQKIVQPNDEFHIAVVVYAYMISTVVGYAIAFVLNRKATFHADSSIALSTFLYVLMVCLIIYVNGVTGPMISNLVGRLPFPAGVTEAISKFACMMAAGLWSYPINRFVVHRKRKEKASADA